jgi:hypothetical protein
MGRSASQAGHEALDEYGVPRLRDHNDWSGSEHLSLVERIHWLARSRSVVPPLVGTTEAADILGVPSSNLSGSRPVRGLPEPVAQLRGGRVFVRAEIEALAAERARARNGGRS